MQVYPIPMVPGPVKVPEKVLAAYQKNYGSPDLEPEFLALYNRTEKQLQTLLGTSNQVIIKTGEGMIALWSALKSCLKPDDRVLSLATGVFGYGIGEMAKSIGAQVKTLGFPYNETLSDWNLIEKTIADFRPKMITAVHCETPSGTLNPLEALGKLKEKHHVPLYYVDVVASVGGVPVKTDEWHIDLALGGSQKVLSAPPEMAFLSVSPAAWEIINEVNYSGYDALLPFQHAQEKHYFPYTPSWHGVAALNTAAEILLKEGLPASFARHEQVARYIRSALVRLGYELYPAEGAISSPTVTAAHIPANLPWQDFDARLRAMGLVVGNSYGPLAGKIFRLGHMGSQANILLAEKVIEVLTEVSKTL